jgi:hypothetical protein
MFSITR